MKILLVKPHYSDIYSELKSVATEYPPLGLMYIASFLEKDGNEVKIVDMSAEKLSKENLLEIAGRFSPDIVGFTVTTPLSKRSHDLASEIKARFNNMKIVFGGPHPTALPEEELKDKNVDFVVCGEGEITFSELVKSSFDNLESIKGLCFKNNGKIICNNGRDFISNLDSLPLPAWHLISLENYFFVDARRYPIAPMLTSRGCPYGCIYCNKNIAGRVFRCRSPENVVDEIEFLVREKKVREIHILDDACTTIPERMIEICNRIIERNIDCIFDCANGIRANSATPELLSKMKKAGFYKVAFGIESGDEKILENIDKGLKIETVRKAVESAKNAGLEVWGFFMIGLPGETRETVEKTANLAIELGLDVAKFYITTPMPGTKLFEMWKGLKYIRDFDWSKYSFYSSPVYETPNMSAQELTELHKYCFRKFYMRPKYILKRLASIRSTKHLISVFKVGLGIARMSLK